MKKLLTSTANQQETWERGFQPGLSRTSGRYKTMWNAKSECSEQQTNKQKSNQTQHQQSGSGNSIVVDLLVLSTRHDDIYHNLGATEEISTSSEFTSVTLSANLAKQPSSLSLWWTCWNPKVMQRSPLLESWSNSKKQFVCSLNFNSCLDPLKTSFVAKVKSLFLRKLLRTRRRRSRCS